MASGKRVAEKLEAGRAGVSRQIAPGEWRAIFKRVAEKLPQGRQWRVTLIGGAAMALGYGGRRTTEDADVIDTPPEVLEAARAVAAEFGLNREWMNANAEEAGYVVPSAAAGTETVMSEPSLEVCVPSLEHMLAMKVARLAEYPDEVDAKTLLSRMKHLDTVEDVWNVIGGLVPVAGRSQAKHNLEKLWELIHGPA